MELARQCRVQMWAEVMLRAHIYRRQPAMPLRCPAAYLNAALLASLMCAIASAAPLTQSATAPATRPAAELEFRTERVVVFKDGHGLIVKSGTAVADADGRALTFDVPDAAVLGCFWAVGEDR